MSGEKYLLRVLGGNVCLVSIATFCLGIADVVIIKKECDNKGDCGNSSLSYILAWIAVGIWASIPLFINGIVALWVSTHLIASDKGWLAITSFLSSLIFAPALVVISSFELYYRYKDVGLSPFPTVNEPRFGVPFAIGIAGILLFIHVLILFIYTGCCLCIGNTTDSQNIIVIPADNENNCRISSSTSPYRWTNIRPLSEPKRAAPRHVNYYANGEPPTRCSNVGASGVYAIADSDNSCYPVPRTRGNTAVITINPSPW